MLSTTGTDYQALGAIVAAPIGRTAMLAVRWRVTANCAWSFGVYYVGYRLLSVQYRCGSLAVSSVPLVLKLAA